MNLAIFALDGVFFYSLSYSALQPHHHSWLGPLAFVLAVFYLALARFVRTSSNLTRLCLGLCAAFLALAIPIQFSGFAITTAWSMEPAGLTWLGVHYLNRRALLAAFALFALAVLHVIIRGQPSDLRRSPGQHSLRQFCGAGDGLLSFRRFNAVSN
jgi:uncharacterized membrane protein